HLFLSGDRGATWSERALPPQPVQITTITFVDAQHGWVLSTGSPATQCQAQGAAIWRTDDGARTWKRIVDLVVGANAQPVAGISPGQCKEDLAFADATHGFFDSWDPNSRPTVYRTTDGGMSWAATRLPDPPGFTTQTGGFSLHPGPVADFGAVQLVSALGNSGTKDTTYVFRSTDGGASWTYAATTPDLSPGAVIVFLTATRWIAPLAPAPWDETADGGATWHAFTTDYSQAAPIAPQIVFGDAETGYATVRGGLQRTTDGGAHWTALKTPGT
ncbi:MAG: glycoside hydrolase, partial [Chloroflexi bacterium]|nr:glycoside hydrolase [Chloroflexota bacterium]